MTKKTEVALEVPLPVFQSKRVMAPSAQRRGRGPSLGSVLLLGHRTESEPKESGQTNTKLEMLLRGMLARTENVLITRLKENFLC